MYGHLAGTALSSVWSINSYIILSKSRFLLPAMKLGQGNIFRSVCPHSVQGGLCGCLGGGWGCKGWLLPGGHVWLLWGVCVVAPGGMHGCSWRGAWLLRGACVVAPRGVCVVAPGGRGHAGCSWGACMVAPGGVCVGYDNIQSYSQ